MNKKPLVSAIIPAFNAERYIAQAIESVIAQTLDDIEIIVVNDGSTDSTLEKLIPFGDRIKVLNQENKGLGAARNSGVGISQGKFIAFLDSDDIWIEDKTEKQVEYINEREEIDIVFGGVEVFETPELPSTSLSSSTFEIPQGFLASTMLIPRDVFLSVGMFTEDRRAGEFIEWYSRAFDAGYMYHVLPEIVLRRRKHDSNMTLKGDAKEDYLYVVKSILRRRSK